MKLFSVVVERPWCILMAINVKDKINHDIKGIKQIVGFYNYANLTVGLLQSCLYTLDHVIGSFTMT